MRLSADSNFHVKSQVSVLNWRFAIYNKLKLSFMQTWSAIHNKAVKRLYLAGAISVMLWFSIAGLSQAKGIDQCLITKEGIGSIRLGMTLHEAKAVLSTATFKRGTDGDGAALIDVMLGNDNLVILYAGEDNPGAPIDWSKKISFLETFSPNCKTVKEIAPGMLVRKAEKKLGETTEITLSEIESREYIQFKNQPKYLLYRLDYAGIFAPNSKPT